MALTIRLFATHHQAPCLASPFTSTVESSQQNICISYTDCFTKPRHPHLFDPIRTAKRRRKTGNRNLDLTVVGSCKSAREDICFYIIGMLPVPPVPWVPLLFHREFWDVMAYDTHRSGIMSNRDSNVDGQMLSFRTVGSEGPHRRTATQHQHKCCLDTFDLSFIFKATLYMKEVQCQIGHPSLRFPTVHY